MVEEECRYPNIYLGGPLFPRVSVNIDPAVYCAVATLRKSV